MRPFSFDKIFEAPVTFLKNEFSKIDFGDNFYIVVPKTNIRSAREVTLLLGKVAPGWIYSLMNLRNTIVKPFGLETGQVNDDVSTIKKDSDWLSAAPIVSESAEMMVFGLDDSHLDFKAAISLQDELENQQRISIETVVKFNNVAGRTYFFFVKPFHKVIIKTFLQRLSDELRTDRK